MIKDIEARLSYQGLKLDQYLKMMNKKEDDLRLEFEEQAKISVKSRLVLEAISNDAKIEVSKEEIDAKIKEMATNYGRKEEDLVNNDNLKDYLVNNIKSEKTIKYIVDNAKIK